ncbi:hypothetical protein Val02_22640 [Virgisporangium aliadipatigenens]|uniref:ABC transporter domain-containing protein n=1 Tax=Virgisporangium aliadipatigenens TaxID=741659 RepID=A0A8J3YJP5_9ACTN|nr:ATP-binding cassette domain-containing protein [Virgisporangium aliadipatigenens]GIJ45378.1 hypothetical protein Val02_22640 [Virgisporangium aliadipatigenens]
MSVLDFDRVTVTFGRHTVVRDVSLAVPEGAVVGLVGGSGCGKSTLARAAAGLVPLAGGRITVDGGSPRGRISMVFQDPYSSLDPRMRIGATLAEALPRRTPDRKSEVARLLDLVDLAPDRARMYPHQLSGGQRQRVAIARALAGDPDVIIADEITSALDVSIQGTVLNLIRELHRRMRLTVLFISHNLAVVRYVSDTIAVMQEGRIVEHGPADDVLSAPEHPYTRELLEAVTP